MKALEALIRSITLTAYSMQLPASGGKEDGVAHESPHYTTNWAELPFASAWCLLNRINPAIPSSAKMNIGSELGSGTAFKEETE